MGEMSGEEGDDAARRERAPQRAWLGHTTRRRLFAVNAFAASTARPEMNKQGSLVSTTI